MIRFVAFLFILAAPFGCHPAFAQAPRCGPWADTTAGLWENYGEAVAAEMIDTRGGVLHLFASPETGTWTLTLTRPGGLTCGISAGGDFQAQTSVDFPTGAEPEGGDL